MNHAATPGLDDLRNAPALEADPRPGTRELAATALGHLGIDLVHCAADRVVARTTAAAGSRPALLLVLAETAASTAAGIAAGPGRRAFGAELDAALLAAPAPGIVVASATPLQLGPDRHTWRITALDAHDALVLEARCTLGIVDAPTP